MLHKIIVTTAFSGLLIGAAAAQSTQPMQSGQAPSASAPDSSRMDFINAQGADQWLSSNFVGVDVIGPNDEKIGDVSDILFDKSGKVVGYVVGVGGFLGIGTKNVALAPSSFQVVPAAERATTGASPATSTAASSDDIKLKLSMTKDQLKQAAAFETKSERDAKSRAASQPGNPATRPAPSSTR